MVVVDRFAVIAAAGLDNILYDGICYMYMVYTSFYFVLFAILLCIATVLCLRYISFTYVPYLPSD